MPEVMETGQRRRHRRRRLPMQPQSKTNTAAVRWRKVRDQFRKAKSAIDNRFRSTENLYAGIKIVLRPNHPKSRVCLFVFLFPKFRNPPNFFGHDFFNSSHVSCAKFVARVQSLPYMRGTTDTGLALQRGLEEILEHRRTDGLTVVFVVTDGGFRDLDRVLVNAPKIQAMPNVLVYAAAVPQHYSLSGAFLFLMLIANVHVHILPVSATKSRVWPIGVLYKTGEREQMLYFVT